MRVPPAEALSLMDERIKAYQRIVARLEDRVETLEAALRRVEWVDDGGWGFCPECGGQEPVGRWKEKYGHEPGCTVAAALAPSREPE